MIFVNIEDVLIDGPIYPSEVLCGPCKDVVVVAQEIDEVGLGFVIQHSGDDDLLAGVTFE